MGGQVLVDLVGVHQIEGHEAVFISEVPPLVSIRIILVINRGVFIVGALHVGHEEVVSEALEEGDLFDTGLHAPVAGGDTLALKAGEALSGVVVGTGGREVAAERRHETIAVLVVAGEVPGAEHGSTEGGLVGSLSLHVPASGIGGVVRSFVGTVGGGELQGEGIEVGEGSGSADPPGITMTNNEVGLMTELRTPSVGLRPRILRIIVFVLILFPSTTVKSGIGGPHGTGDAVELQVGNEAEEIVVAVGVEVGRTVRSDAAPQSGDAEPIGHRSGNDHAFLVAPASGHNGVLAESVAGQTELHTAHTHLDVSGGHLPVEVHLTGGEALAVLVAVGVVSGAPLILTDLEVHITGEVFRGGHGQAEAQTMLGVFLVLASEVLFTGHEGHAIAGVDLDVNSRSGSGSGHDHTGGSEKSNELFHSVIPLKKVGSKLNLGAWKIPLFPRE